MSRRTFPSITVETDSNHFPYQVHCRGRTYRVQVIDEWQETRRWWQGETKCVFYRLSTDDKRVLDVCWEPESGQWTLLGWHD